MGERLRRLATPLVVAAAGVFAAATVLAFGTPEGQHSRRPSDFAAEIRQLSARIETATPDAAVEIEKTIPAVWTVEHRSRRYEVPAGWLQAALRDESRNGSKWSTARSTIVARLIALAKESEAMVEEPAGPSPSDVRAALEKVLQDPEFARLHTQNAASLLWQRLAEWFDRILRRLGLGRIAGAATADAIAWTVSLLALGALGVWLASLLRHSQRRTRLVDGPPPETVSAQQWARRAAAAADVREAVRYAYHAAMCRLEEEGVWRVDAARTPREYLRLLPYDHRRRRPIIDLARRFEEIWYGARPATNEDRVTLLGTLRELECLPAE